MKEKIVLIGAGSAMFTRGLVIDLIRRKWDAELVLVDIDPEALEVARRLTRKLLKATGSKVRLSATVDRRQALRGATAVICTIGVGGRRAWELDVLIPRKYGVFQAVGDTVMPGGTSRALRMVPAMVAIAKDVLDIAPQALFFNYGNPMAVVCHAVRKATGAPMIGLCHGVLHVGQYLAKQLKVSERRLTYTAVGINHLTWFTRLAIDGCDAMPRLRQVAAARLRRLGTPQRLAKSKTDQAPEENPFSWQLFELFGAFPAVLDRHVTEFFPQFFRNGKYFGKTLGVDAFSFERAVAWGDRTFDEMRQHAFSRGPLPKDYLAAIGGEQEQVIDIIASIRAEDRKVYSANLPNQGQVPNLPEGMVIECPAIADGGTLKVIGQEPLAPALAGTLASRFMWVDGAADAALAGSREKFIQALVIDGSVDSLEMAATLADDLLRAHAAYLPQFSVLAGTGRPGRR